MSTTPPVAPASLKWSMSATPPVDPASHPDPDTDGPVVLDFSLIRKTEDSRRRREGKLPILNTERLQGKLGEVFAYKRDNGGITLLYGKELEDLAKRLSAKVGVPFGGQLMGTVTFTSKKTMEESLTQVTHMLRDKKSFRGGGLPFVLYGVDLLKNMKDVVVEMKREWYVLVRDMLEVKGSGEGRVVPQKERATRQSYAEMGKLLTKALDLGLPTEQLAEIQLAKLYSRT
ncbi:hypothetical protein F5878DRAFT_621701 [Lentinula raphanica]|uniref:Uncharacterized protein n=1 Tax=Lentinula raphanica TaxID=153919 RepID=A0AA38P7F9_9AGAR|nr:hypothetical protein F5878DRAFT_621701 [Lentinula raphanica]